MVVKTDSLSIKQARKLILLSQRIPPRRQTGSAIEATMSAIDHLGYIQIDTISVIQRAHHHTLWNRNPRYEKSHLDQLVEKKQVFEYLSHAAAYLSMKDYRYSLPRKRAIAKGEPFPWYERDNEMMKKVLKRIESEGPLLAREFDHSGNKKNGWGHNSMKRALEYLFLQGDLMVPYRVNFQKAYDLTERVLPENIDTTFPTPEEHARFLINRFLQANGLGRSTEITYLLSRAKPPVSSTLKKMISNEEILKLKVAGEIYYMLPGSMELLEKPLLKNKLKILSPFDNLLIQRKRMQNLFDFNYLIECYLPKKKRQYGYFSLPILWDGTLVARMDCKADRHRSTLHLLHIALESTLKKKESFAIALSRELPSFIHFNNCADLKLHRTTPASFEPVFRNAINDLMDV